MAVMGGVTFVVWMWWPCWGSGGTGDEDECLLIPMQEKTWRSAYCGVALSYVKRVGEGHNIRKSFNYLLFS